MPKPIPTESEASIKTGTWLIHKDGENCIQIWGSNINGKEEIYLNGNLVSEKRSIGKNSEHQFTTPDSVTYHINIQVTDMLNHSVSYIIKKNGEPLKVFKTHLQAANNHLIIRFIIIILLSVLFTLIKIKYQFPEFTLYIFLAGVLLMHSLTRKKGQILIET